MSCTHYTLHCTRLLSNTSQMHYIAHYTVRVPHVLYTQHTALHSTNVQHFPNTLHSSLHCPCATCPVHTTHRTALDYCPTLPNCITSLITLSVCHMSCSHNTLQSTGLLSNTSQLHYIAHYTVRVPHNLYTQHTAMHWTTVQHFPTALHRSLHCPCATCPVHTTHCNALDYCPTLSNCITSLITLSMCHMSCTHNTSTALDYCPTLPKYIT
jgi:hypothetical protein